MLDWITSKREAELRTVIGFGVTAQTLSYSGSGLWWLGYPEQARRRCVQAVTGAIERGDPYGQAFACAIDCTVLFLVRSDETGWQARSELSHRLSLEQGFSMWPPYIEVFLGRLAVMRGEDFAGIDRIQRAITRWQIKGMEIAMDYLNTVLADGCLAAARRRKAATDAAAQEQRLSLLETGLAAIVPLLGPQVHCGPSHQAELCRLRGELLLERDGLASADEALACFHQSMQIAQEQGALAWELRAAMSLLHPRQHQGEAFTDKLAEALRLLCDLYARFIEGFSFRDLQKAAVLIGEAG